MRQLIVPAAFSSLLGVRIRGLRDGTPQVPMYKSGRFLIALPRQ
jgi:hypothetical protein